MIPLLNKQYVLSSVRLDIPEAEYLESPIGHLYVGENTRVQHSFTSDQNPVLLIGSAYCVNKVGCTPLQQIEKSPLSKIKKISKNWTGRWVIISKEFLLTDAGGLMSAFYYKKNGQWFISSSLALMAQLLRKNIDERASSVGLTWQLLPMTLIPEVYALQCTQYISFERESIRIMPFPRFEDKREMTTRQKVKALSDMLKTAMLNINEFSERQIVIALTGGKDSRLVLAAALASGVKFQTYTALYAGIAKCDIMVPKQLAKACGFQHIIIRPKARNKDREEAYYFFSGNNSNGQDAEFFSRGQFAQLPENSIVIRSGIFEAAQSYGRSLSPLGPSDYIENLQKNYAASFKLSRQREGLTRWVEYARTNPMPHIDIRDRFYIEQRVNGWVSAIEQSLCINDFESIQIANSAEIISILLSANPHERRMLALSFATINALYPDLMQYPVNKSTLQDKINLVLKKVKNMIAR